MKYSRPKKKRKEILIVDKKDKIVLSGYIEKLSINLIEVKLDNKLIVNCQLARRIRRLYSSLVIGDVVDVEISTYDLSKGKIINKHLIK